MQKLLVSLSLCVIIAAYVEGHGYLLTPPARGTAWRAGFPTPTDNDDNAMFCGGKGVQHGKINQGRCGVCGEEYSKVNKRLEPGPANRYATGTIVGNYQQGETIDVTIQITAFHKGYYEFRLCENNVPQKGKDSNIAITPECLAQNLLKNANTGGTRFTATPGRSTHQVELPAHVSCSACVLQWRYRCGNNWGCENDKCGTGLGDQEEFYGCSDIAIAPLDVKTTPSTTVTTPTQTTVTSAKPETTTKPVTTMPDTTTTTPAPTRTQPTTPAPTTQPTTPAPTRTQPTTPEPTTTQPTTPAPTTKPTTPKPTPPKPTPPRPTPPKPTMTPKPADKKPDGTRKVCNGAGLFSGPNFDTYCQQNCNHVPPYCPPSHCKCAFV